MNLREPGLFRKIINKQIYMLSIYVDDTLLCGPDEKVVKDLLNKTLKKFPGKVINPKIDKVTGDEISDLLGCTLLYNRKERTFKIHMRNHIEK